MKLKLLIALFVTALPASAAFAESITIEKVTATPSPAKVGQPVQITIEASNADQGICGLSVKWGDGVREKPEKVGGVHKTFPLTFQHTYTKPGTYEIKADGKRAETYLDCMGEAKFMITVEPAEKVVTAANPTKTTCPANWALKGKVTQNGSYTCTPKKKNAAKPEKPLDCPEGTSYFMSNKALGCEKSQ